MKELTNIKLEGTEARGGRNSGFKKKKNSGIMHRQSITTYTTYLEELGSRLESRVLSYMPEQLRD